MQHRKSASVSVLSHGRRPSGTDGSDFSYRMVVESRYKKVAEGRKQLVAYIVAQVFIQLMGAVSIILTKALDLNSPSTLYISSVVLGSFALLMGELGRRRSLANFLRFYMFASSIALILSAVYVAKSSLISKVIQDPAHLSNWKEEGREMFEIIRVLFWFMIQVFSVTKVNSLVKNMSPPKKMQRRST